MASDESYPDLLNESGWDLIEQVNLSAEFLATLRVKLKNEIKYAQNLENLLGKDETEIRLNRTQICISALELGLIRRELFHAIPAPHFD